MNRILFICKGNICRSPFAAAAAQKLGLGECRSAGTESYHEGKGADPVTIKIAQDYGLDLTCHTAHRVTREDLEWADMVFVMDHENLSRLREISVRPRQGQVVNLLDERRGEGIPDPYRKDVHEYRYTFDRIIECCAFIGHGGREASTPST